MIEHNGFKYDFGSTEEEHVIDRIRQTLVWDNNPNAAIYALERYDSSKTWEQRVKGILMLYDEFLNNQKGVK